TCPLCREKWNDAGTGSNSNRGAAAGPSYSSEGYLNLAASAGISAQRDTSTLLDDDNDDDDDRSDYHGPRRGSKYPYGRRGSRREDNEDLEEWEYWGW
ncbi:hypothetical protein JCM11491_000003, partial [Sporobolomyces phaffii]